MTRASVARSMFPPLITHTTRSPASWSRSFIAAISGAARALGEVVRRAQRQPDTAGELVFGERHDIVELTLKDAEWQIEGHARRHAFGERIGALADDARMVAPRARERVGAGRLHADD